MNNQPLMLINNEILYNYIIFIVTYFRIQHIFTHLSIEKRLLILLVNIAKNEFSRHNRTHYIL